MNYFSNLPKVCLHIPIELRCYLDEGLGGAHVACGDVELDLNPEREITTITAKLECPSAMDAKRILFAVLRSLSLAGLDVELMGDCFPITISRTEIPDSIPT
jgi:hypothetical protein